MYLRLEPRTDKWRSKMGYTVLQQIGLRDVSNSDIEEAMADLKLYPGIAVVYASNLRYQNVPPEALTVDMFDAESPAGSAVEKRVGVPKLVLVDPPRRPFETRSFVDGALPRALADKIAALHVVGASLGVTTASRVTVPNVGVVFGTGVAWVILTEEDCRDAQQETQERSEAAAAEEVQHGG